MIVREQDDGTLCLISQNDHALLSGTLAAHWGNERFDRPEPYDSVVRAAAFHDRGWIDYEAMPSIRPDGRPPNYREVPTDERQLRAFQWTGDWLSTIDPYSGLLAAKHRTGLWQNRYDVIREPRMGARGPLKPELQAFIERSEAKQHAVETGLDAAQVRRNYRLLQVWDLISLYLCSMARLTPLTLGPVPLGAATDADVDLLLTPLSQGRVAVDPFPFDQSSIRVGYVYRTVPATPFESAEAFREVYFKAPLVLANFDLVPD
jgi:hypothetical protein